MVLFIVPCGGFGGLKGEGVRVEEEATGLNPSEVPGSTSWPVAYEPSIDLDDPVRDQAEVLVALAMEVEYDAVSSDEARIIAC